MLALIGIVSGILYAHHIYRFSKPKTSVVFFTFLLRFISLGLLAIWVAHNFREKGLLIFLLFHLIGRFGYVAFRSGSNHP